jgi:hypothetical protein
MLSPLYHDFPTSMLMGIAGASPLSAFGRSVGMLSFCAEIERATKEKTKSKKSLIKRDITEKLGKLSQRNYELLSTCRREQRQ